MCCGFCVAASHLQAQILNTAASDTADETIKGKFKIDSYIDAYYGYDFSRPSSRERAYCVSMNRHNEFNINLAYVDMKYIRQNLRARFVPAFGTYMNANYAAETGSLKNLLEASVGIKLKKIWLDIGVLGSPYTNESAISKDQLMYTRSFSSEFSPYYLAGLKLTAPISQKISFYFYLVNGWQQIRDENEGKSIGTQIEYRPNKKILINWNTYIGNEQTKTSPLHRMRYFTDFYVIAHREKWDLTTCTYIGYQERKDTLHQNTLYVLWWQANAIFRYNFDKKNALSARVEYFHDENRVQIPTIVNKNDTLISGFTGGSFGACYTLKQYENMMFRFEVRRFFSRDALYGENPARDNTLLISNVTIWF